jgi:hypothetical protein
MLTECSGVVTLAGTAPHRRETNHEESQDFTSCRRRGALRLAEALARRGRVEAHVLTVVPPLSLIHALPALRLLIGEATARLPQR